MNNLHITRTSELLGGRPVIVTRITGDKQGGKTFLAQANAHWLTLTGAADCVLVLDESGSNYYLRGGHEPHTAPRRITDDWMTQFLAGRQNVHIVIAGNVPNVSRP